MIRTSTIISTLLCTLLAVGAAWAEPVDPIRVGLTTPQSGPFMELGREFRRGVEFWVRDVNERGALLGRPVELVVRDDQSDAQIAVQEYERLITEDRVDLLIGPYSSTLALAVSAVAEKHGFPMLIEAAAPVVYEQGFDNVFGIYTPANKNMVDVLSFAQENSLSRVALAYQASEFPEAVADGVRRKAAGYGLSLVFDESYPEGLADLTGFVERLVESQPEVIIVGSYLNDAIAFMKSLKATGRAPKILAFSGGPALVEFGQALGADTQGIIVTTQWMRDARIPGSFDFGYRFREHYGVYPSFNSAGGYAAGQILEAAVRLAATTDRVAVREQLRGLKFRSILGHYRVDESGQQVGKPIYLIQWQDGHRSLVRPEDVARWEVRYPFPGWGSR